MTKLDWDKLRRNDRVARPAPGSSADTIRPIVPRHELSSAELSQLAARGRELLRASIGPKAWLKRYEEFERQAHLWSAHPELHEVYRAIQQRHSDEHSSLTTGRSSEKLSRVTTRVVRLESCVSESRSRAVNVETLIACHEMMEQLRASLPHSQRLDLLLRFRRVVGAIGMEKLNHFLVKRASGAVVDSHTVRRWLYVTNLYAPTGQVGESLKELAERLRREVNL